MQAYSGIFALDLSPSCVGWARILGGVTSSSIWEPHPYEKPGQLFNEFQLWLAHKLARSTADDPSMLMVLEQPHLRGRISFKTVGMYSVAVMVADRYGHGCVDVHSRTLKKHATGHGNCDKDAMIDAARRRGWRPRNDDEADALWLADYAKQMSLVGHWPTIENLGKLWPDKPLTKKSLISG